MAEVGSYVVVVKADVTPEKLDEIFHALNITPKHRYNIGTFKGFAADLTDDQLKKVSERDEVDYFEADGIATAFSQSLPKKKSA